MVLLFNSSFCVVLFDFGLLLDVALLLLVIDEGFGDTCNFSVFLSSSYGVDNLDTLVLLVRVLDAVLEVNSEEGFDIGKISFCKMGTVDREYTSVGAGVASSSGCQDSSKFIFPSPISRFMKTY